MFTDIDNDTSHPSPNPSKVDPLSHEVLQSNVHISPLQNTVRPLLKQRTVWPKFSIYFMMVSRVCDMTLK